MSGSWHVWFVAHLAAPYSSDLYALIKTPSIATRLLNMRASAWPMSAYIYV